MDLAVINKTPQRLLDGDWTLEPCFPLLSCPLPSSGVLSLLERIVSISISNPVSLVQFFVLRDNNPKMKVKCLRHTDGHPLASALSIPVVIRSLAVSGNVRRCAYFS